MSEVSTASTWGGWGESAKPLQKSKKEIGDSLREMIKEYQTLVQVGWTEESEEDRSNFDDNIDTLINRTAAFIKESVDMVATSGCTDEKQIVKATEKVESFRIKIFAAVEKMPPVSDNNDAEAKTASEKTLEYRRKMLADIGTKVTIKMDEQMALGADCLLYTSPSPRDRTRSRMPSSA